MALALDSRKSVPLDRFGPRMLADVQHELAVGDMPKKRAGHTKRSRTQVAKTVNAIRAMFKWAVSQEMIGPDRLVALKTVLPLKPGLAREGDSREPVAEKIVAATKKRLPAVVADMVEFMLRTGCRPSEAMRLRMADVEQAPAAWRWTLAKHKNTHRKKRRVIAIGPRAAAIAKRWRQDYNTIRPHSALGYQPPAPEARQPSAVEVRYREAFREWLRSIGVEEEEFQDHGDKSIYLIGECDYSEDQEDVLQESAAAIFYEEVSARHLDSEQYPDFNDFALSRHGSRMSISTWFPTPLMIR